jgi:GT2 family glycosyltransferase
MKNNYSNVTIVIPNWNGMHLLQKYLPVVIQYSPESPIIVVDDASTDGSIEWLQSQYPAISVIKRSEQGGFAKAVNTGVRHAKTDYVVLLNSDIEPLAHYLDAALSHFEDEKVFAVGFLDESIEEGKKVQRGRGIAWWENGFVVHKKGEVDKTDTAWVSAGSGIFKKLLWDKLGGLDDLFSPFYWEDIDLSYRARKAGYTIVFEPKSTVIHRHEEGAIKKNYKKNAIERIAFRNQLIFIWKNITNVTYLQSHVFSLPVLYLKMLIKGNPNYLFGFLKAVFLLPQILNKRRQLLALWRKYDEDLLQKMD